eukprot:CAMPEP_0117529030 /NCGR_PEP_ID=MMETSP0784-20121206/37623_1 /TAXON_ID=39447 /ORGANISM="" /LENGTH=460 /DNA_ID=CAMNT_0005325341 /DNA_START=66 /DNA_END=1448 /DNA_ORIENTATION=-
MAPTAEAKPSAMQLSFDILRQSAHPSVHPVLDRNEDLAGVYREALELLKRGDGGASDACGVPCRRQDLASLGERALELDELQGVVRAQWSTHKERNAVHKKLLSCGIDSPCALLRALGPQYQLGGPTPYSQGSSSQKCPLNQLLDDAGFSCFRPETISRLASDLDVRVHQRIETCEEGTQPVLVTAPHNIFLLRDGQPAHVMEEYTTLIAQRVARQLGGTYLVWSRAEQHRSELLWSLSNNSGQGNCGEAGSYLDPRNRDPNYLSTDEVTHNVWFKQMLGFAERASAQGSRDPINARSCTMLHVDVHGCRDPPCTPSHLTVGLAAMRHEADRGRGPLTVARVEAFGRALEAELASVLRGLPLRPKAATLVRVLLPSLPADSEEPVERLSGAWRLALKRVTQSQQAVAFAGFSHSCQLELSKSLRRALIRESGATVRLAKALHAAWASTAQVLPPLRPSTP